jgi:5-methylthioadenosine/S-adenosylhomocysteine deaminase
VVPVDPPGVVLDPGWVRVEGNRITAVGGPGDPPGLAGGAVVRVVDAGGGLVLPGFISVHQHVLDILVRGGGVPTSFPEWLFGLYYGAISAYRPPDAAVASLLGAVESVRAGVTCVVDNWGVCSGDAPGTIRACAEASLASYATSGLRVLLACMFATQLPDAWSRLPFRYDPARLTAPLEVALAWIGDLRRDHHGRGDGRIEITAAPELPEMVGADGLVAAGALAGDSGTVAATHLLASPSSREWADAARLAEMGAFGHPLIGAHCSAATPDDLRVLARHGVGVGHCPTANSALGGMVSAAPMRAAGLAVGLGSDNASLNRNSDVLAEARRAVLASRVLAPPEEWIDARSAIEMATIEGARAIGMADRIGSLTPGKLADLIVIDTSGPHWWPRHDWLDSLVHQGRASDVRTVIVNGEVLLEDGELTFLDRDGLARLGRETQAASLRVRERARLGW